MEQTKMNHEIWATCPECGCEYDRRVWGDTCPKCAGRALNAIRQASTGKKERSYGYRN